MPTGITPDGLLIFGATSPSGVALATRARAAGHEVTGVARDPAKAAALEAAGVRTVAADALDAAQVEAAFAGSPLCKVVVSLLGGRPGTVRFPDYEGNRHVIDAAKAHGAHCVVLVTSVGAGDSRPAMPPAAAAILGPIADLKTRAEDYLRSSGVPFIILRPGHLTGGPATGTAALFDDPLVNGAIARDELGRVILASIGAGDCRGRAWAVAEPATVAEARRAGARQI
jgi:nucleoside-diphosphate-sugar epimerase